MSKSLKITWDEVIELLQDHYKIKNIKLMVINIRDTDNDLLGWNTIGYIEGEVDE